MILDPMLNTQDFHSVFNTQPVWVPHLPLEKVLGAQQAPDVVSELVVADQHPSPTGLNLGESARGMKSPSCWLISTLKLDLDHRLRLLPWRTASTNHRLNHVGWSRRTFQPERMDWNILNCIAAMMIPYCKWLDNNDIFNYLPMEAPLLWYSGLISSL